MHLGGLRTAALSALLLASVSGCGGSSNSGTGKISVHLMDAPGDYLEVNVDVQEVQINGPNGWESLPTKAGVINLLDFQNGFTTTLVNEFGIEAGHYTQLRLLLGSDNTIVTEGEGGARVSSPLKVPSGMQSGIKLNVNFDVEPGTTKDVFIDFDAHRSVFVHGAGASGQYILRPVVFCYDKLITGSISGTVTDTATGQPLVGAGVSAQTIGADGIPSVLRSTDHRRGRTLRPGAPVGRPAGPRRHAAGDRRQGLRRVRHAGPHRHRGRAGAGPGHRRDGRAAGRRHHRGRCCRSTRRRLATR